ncbi:peptidase A4 family domain-containing protein [Trichoderma chlorosporum]
MKSLTFVANVLLVASAALATPLAPRKQAAIEALRARNAVRRSNKLQASGTHSVNGTADVESTNWAGAAITVSGITEVSGTFVVPTPKVPSGGSSNNEYCGAAWVGIDGYSDADLIQTGVLWCIQGGEVEYEAWYEYLPASLVAYSGITIKAGASVTVTATKTSSNGGTTTLSSGGKTVSHTFSNQNSPLPGTSAEWIVEDFTSGSSLVPFANFGSVTFTGSSAVVNGQTVTPGSEGSTIIDLENSSGKIITSTTVSGGSVTVNYE